MIILIILQCLSAKDNSRLYLFVFHLTTLTRWIGKRSTNVVKCFSSCAGVCYLLNLCMRMCYGNRCQGTYIKSTKNPGFHTFFEILGISLEIPSISNSRCEKPSISKFLIRNTQYFNRNPRFLIEILGISIEILGYSFELLGISKTCDNRIPYKLGNQQHSAKIILSPLTLH